MKKALIVVDVVYIFLAVVTMDSIAFQKVITLVIFANPHLTMLYLGKR